MRYYNIDSADGQELCSGLSTYQVDGAAQRHADSTGSLVLVYSSDGEEEWIVYPKPPKEGGEE